MKEITGQIKSWDEAGKRGVIEGNDGKSYSFTSKEWKEQGQPEIHGGVLVICQNGRDASQVEYLGIEHIPFMKVTTFAGDGKERTTSHSRLIGGPWRMRSDALVWMQVAHGLHTQNSHQPIDDLSELLRGEHPIISLRGSVIKYCYGIAIELYLKWILTEAKIKYRTDHGLTQLIRKLPDPVLSELRSIYLDYQSRHSPTFRMMQAHVHGVEDLVLDWSTFDKFAENLVNQKFIVGRYADPNEYSIFQSLSTQMSLEMNSYMDTDDFFALGERILAYKPNPGDYA